MKTQKYSVNQHLIETILAWVNAEEIAIPEIQRPFVWDTTKVRDFMDSLYHGYPVGYLIAWKNPNVRLKDGTLSEGKKILIDGQQRVTALTAAILGKYIINKEYQRVKIFISFNPIEEKFEVFNPAIEKNIMWIPNIAPLINGEVGLIKSVNNYCALNPQTNSDVIERNITKLMNITKKQIGLIELASDLDIEIVTEIFIRINSKGVVLSQADFAMSKITSNEKFNGPIIRKCIDYFCHLAVAPEFYQTIEDIDKDFCKTHYFQKMSWLKEENDDLYDPDYSDLLRVAFTSKFERGRLSDLVALLSGRNFETRGYEEEIAKLSFEKLENGLLNFINENNFKKFIMIIRSAGFISSSLVRSQNALNFAYIVYLKLREMKYESAEIESFVRKWFVMSILTGRYSGSPESSFDFDIKQITNKGMKEFLLDIESAELSDAYWNASLPQSLNSSVASSPYLNVFLAAQVRANDKGFLSKDILIADLITLKGDIHHIFPKDYLKSFGLNRSDYNQIANYVYMQSEINIRVGNKSPLIYFNEILNQILNGGLKYGGINNKEQLKENFQMNCIPETVFNMDIEDYEEFLKQRRILMAKKISNYYFLL
ncbi:MAG TPA: DUF262 domain-containing protein [bacterium]|nr:DUF262 domain-containing protein [bacterium]HPN42344.1 DUF262 domain-containing protein [bacterium]